VLRAAQGRHLRLSGCGAPAILFRLSLHRRRIRILHLEPVGRAAGTVDGILALRDDAFKAKLAGVGKDGRAIAFDMLIEPDAGALATIDSSVASRTSSGSRRRSSPFNSNQVEGVEEYLVVSAVMTDEIERGNAVVIAGNGFTIDDARARAQAAQRLDD
jgi:hypothetical protein